MKSCKSIFIMFNANVHKEDWNISTKSTWIQGKHEIGNSITFFDNLIIKPKEPYKITHWNWIMLWILYFWIIFSEDGNKKSMIRTQLVTNHYQVENSRDPLHNWFKKKTINCPIKSSISTISSKIPSRNP